MKDSERHEDITAAPAHPPEASARGRLGTFAGVFTPSLLTILGVILFLRLGSVVGEAGLAKALGIIALAHAISILTSLSLSAVATNLRVGAGGDYYLISRTLGPGFGGSIGVVLFLAQAVSIAFYSIGLGEAVSSMLEGIVQVPPRWVAAVTVGLLFVLAWKGLDWASRFQYVVMALLAAALVSFFAGAARGWDPALLAASWSPSGDLPTWAVFALFFPAVTGFTQGVSMSGDLADPGKSIPRGTFLAVGVSGAIYFATAVLLAGTLTGATLVSENDALKRVSSVSWLADVGVLAATSSSAMASFLGAPRILQSLAADRIVPLIGAFARGHGSARNPRNGVVLSAAIAWITIGFGDLDLVAPIVTTFFLISYGLLNYATYVEAHANSPYFRPRFRWFHPRLSLLGALGCSAAVLALDPAVALTSAAVLFGIYQWIERRRPGSSWADGRRSSRFQKIREELLQISCEPDHPRDWRPVLLAFTNDRERRERLLRCSSWLEGGSGFTTVVKLLAGEGARMASVRAAAEEELRDDIARADIEAFPLVLTTSDLASGLVGLLQSHGLGPIRANTVLLNWFDRELGKDRTAGLESFGVYLRLARAQRCNLVILEARDQDLRALEKTPARKRTIDVWFENDATGRLMLLFAYLTTRDERWRRARIRLFTPARAGEPHAAARARVRAMLEDARIEAEPHVVEAADARTIATASARSSLVFLPFRLQGDALTGGFGVLLNGLLDVLPVTALVLAAEEFDLEAGPEEARRKALRHEVEACAEALAAALPRAARGATIDRRD